MKSNISYVLDPVHGEISISNLEKRLISSTLFNRLHYITQLSTVYFIYPNANHTRSAHSIGTMKLASKIFKFSFINSSNDIKNDFLQIMCDNINEILKNEIIDKLTNDDQKRWYNNNEKSIHIFENMNTLDELRNFDLYFDESKYLLVYQILLQAVRITGLLHDVGHLPFSHLAEISLDNIYNLTTDKTDKTDDEKSFCKDYEPLHNSDKDLHEVLGDSISHLIFHEIQQDDNINNIERIYRLLIEKLVNNIFTNKTDIYKSIHKIIDGMLDADRLDYVIRDTTNLGIKTISYDHTNLIRNFILLKDEKNFHFGLKIEALNELERFLESRFHLYNNIIYSADSIKKYQILNQAIVRLAQENLRLSNNELAEKLKNYELPREISGFWKFIKFLDKKESNLDKIEILFQYDESWLLYILKMEYFRLDELYHSNSKNFPNTRQKKTYYGMREILFGENNFINLWNDRYEFCKFLKINLDDLRNITQILIRAHHNMEVTLKKFVKKHEDDYDILFGIRKFKNGYERDYYLTDESLSKILIKDTSKIESYLNDMTHNEVPFYFYVLKTNEKIQDVKDKLRIEILELIIKSIKNNDYNNLKNKIEKIIEEEKGKINV